MLYTEFKLSDDREVWTLEMGIVGNDTAVSKVSIPKPFMGFDKRTSSWTEDRYNGLCSQCGHSLLLDMYLMSNISLQKRDWELVGNCTGSRFGFFLFVVMS